jgi:predicted Zn-dependent protease
MLKKLEAEYARLKFASATPQPFRSHPATEKRIRRLEAKWGKLKDKAGFIEYESVKRGA